MMLYRIKRQLKARIPRGSLAWRALTALSGVVFAPRALYRRLSKDSIFYFATELDMCSLYPRALLDEVLRVFEPRSVLDLGCGTGRSLDHFLAHGVDAVGVEGSAMAISHAAHPERIVQANLNEELDLGRRFDLVWSYEVVEHIHPDYVENLLRSFSNHADRCVLSAARPGQGGQGHFNEQPPEYWIEKFAAHGYRYDAERTEHLRRVPEEFAENLLVFVR